MKKIILVFFLTCSFAYLKAQESFMFHIKYLPGRLYQSTITSDMNMEMNFSGDSATMEKIKEKGMKSPMTIVYTNDMNVDITTGKVTVNNTYPIALYYKNINSKSTINGAESAATPNPLTGQTILGEYTTDGKIQIDSVSGTQINDEIKTMLAKMIDNILNQMHFPDKPMKIGDTFTQQVPFSLPVAGSSLDATINIIYKLKSVENGSAYFDMDESMTLDISTDKNGTTLTVKGTGAGLGTMTYDIKGNYSPLRKANLKMNYDMLVGNLKMSASANIASTTETTMSAAVK